jgi:hypothetical protein
MNYFSLIAVTAFSIAVIKFLKPWPNLSYCLQVFFCFFYGRPDYLIFLIKNSQEWDIYRIVSYRIVSYRIVSDLIMLETTQILLVFSWDADLSISLTVDWSIYLRCVRCVIGLIINSISREFRKKNNKDRTEPHCFHCTVHNILIFYCISVIRIYPPHQLFTDSTGHKNCVQKYLLEKFIGM